ncbi:hypothetical protein LF41_3033 [Lysobacter dokdonensis DS-58]|uniref:Uncharacterized protein n=1 Tax=Lysobacter dokdonensis DS-58 TaxID=1300345 RepID=A0A0A2WHU0_9GAMM|nr:hypothetical protein [Lysobacter dokdonensis]KGQ19383.1 hypothetical protein LF41_3033 [Lysobacter dokdonensis DS-58]
MNTATVIEHFKPAPLMALSVLDALARALRTDGQFPPPLGEIRCEITAATAPAARTFDPPRVLHAFRNRSGYLVLDGTYVDSAEPARRWPLGPGTYRVRVRGDYYQDAELALIWPPPEGVRRIDVPQPQANDAGSVTLLPGPAYPLPDVTTSRFDLGPTLLRGSALGADGTPLPGIRVEALNIGPPFLAPAALPAIGDWPFLVADTDARGEWALVLPDRRYFDNTPEIASQPVIKPISVRIAYPGGAVVRQRNVRLGSETALKNTALRGQVLGRGGTPVAGAVISTSVNARRSKSRADGTWFLYFDLNQVAVPNLTVTATTPAGATATVAAIALQPEAVVVVPTFHIP